MQKVIADGTTDKFEVDCVHLGSPVGLIKCGQPAHHCKLLGCHVVQGTGNRVVPGCATCDKRLPVWEARYSIDPLVVVDRRRSPTDCLRDLLAGRSVFLACSGPSANALPLEDLNRRGVWTMAVNNMAGHRRFRPQAFVCADPPGKFSHSIWMDPAVMKFVPIPKLSAGRGVLRRKTETGEFVRMKEIVSDCPNVWGFKRESWLTPDDEFFLSPAALWGNHDKGVLKTGQPKTVNTMLLAMRLLHYLGASRVFLVGCDFRMAEGYGYCFEQSIEHKRPKNPSAAPRWDNDQYAVTNRWLCEMQRNGVFERFKIEFYNCFRESSLRAFPYVPFEEAVKECKGVVEDAPDLSGWYEK